MRPAWAPADVLIENRKLAEDTVIARHHGDFMILPSDQVQYIDVAPSQMVGVSAGLIPFLEHDDANPRVDGFKHATAGGAAFGH